MQQSTIAMPCNYSGFFDAAQAAQFGIADFDWSNARGPWSTAQPMNCQELLVEQAAAVKAVNPNTHVWVYRNSAKALPWFTDVRTKLDDPNYAGWFIKFGPGPYHVPNCTTSGNTTKCSIFYHDQDQTPRAGDGWECLDGVCDCGNNPCGEYMFDFRNDTLVDYLVNEYVLGPDGLGNPNITGFYCTCRTCLSPFPSPPPVTITPFPSAPVALPPRTRLGVPSLT
jgi:hypothetical protein